VNTAGVVFTTLRILGAVLYLALALAFRAGRVFSRPLRWFPLAQGLAVLTLSSNPLRAELVRSTLPWIYALFLAPVLALFPLLYLAAREGLDPVSSAHRVLAVLLARAPALLKLARSRYAGSDLDAASAVELAEKARTLLQTERLWKNPGLSLQTLADHCAASPRDLSQAINQTCGIGVPAWINGFRLVEAQTLLADNDSRVADIAYEVGFNSLSSFNAAFKERTGLTPTAWRKQLTDS
jgi:AraC-like DNA-binding protein